MLTSVHLVFSSTRCATQESRAEEISNKLSNLKREEKNRAKKIQDVERTIQNVQADLAKPIQVESMTEIDDEMVRLCPFVECTFPNLWTASPSSKSQRHA